MKNRFAFFAAILTGWLTTGCSSDNNVPIVNQENTARYTNVLTDLSHDVITETYRDLYTSASTLKTAADAFAIGDQTQLESVKTAWRQTRVHWEQSEAFNYGPADANGADAMIDTWPIDTDAMLELLENPEPITADTLQANNEVRGLHLIERLAWGESGNKMAADFTPKEVELLRAAASDLQTTAQQLYDGWRLDSGNYGANFINAGQSGSVYTAQELALEAIVNGMIALADEVANTKIQGPLIQGNIAEESATSANTLSDLRNNLLSIQHLYTGDRNGVDGNGIDSLLGDSPLDSAVVQAIDEAIQAIDAIPGTFSDALTANPEYVENAYTKAAALHAVLQSELLPHLVAM